MQLIEKDINDWRINMFVLLAGGLLVIIVAVVIAVVSAVAAAVAASQDTED